MTKNENFIIFFSYDRNYITILVANAKNYAARNINMNQAESYLDGELSWRRIVPAANCPSRQCKDYAARYSDCELS